MFPGTFAYALSQNSCAAIFASLATAVAMTVGISRFFSRVTKEKLPYDACVALVCVGSFTVSTIEVEVIARFVSPVLVLLYPAAIVLVILNVLRCRIINRGAFVGATFAALAVSISEAVQPIGAWDGILPLAVHGLAWAVPAAICGAIGTLVYALYRRLRAWQS